jgi:hypothetical protein
MSSSAFVNGLGEGVVRDASEIKVSRAVAWEPFGKARTRRVGRLSLSRPFTLDALLDNMVRIAVTLSTSDAELTLRA